MSSELRHYTVYLPIAGHAILSVEAESEDAALEKAWEADLSKDAEIEWEALEQFTRGNVCYCPSPWEATAEDDGPVETEA